MFIIVGADGKEYGPVSSGQVRAWITDGRANLQTKCRRANDTEWKTLADFPEFGADARGSAVEPAMPPAAAAVSAVSVAPAAPAVEATPGADPVALSGGAGSIAAGLMARAAPLDVFGCLARSFELWKANFLPLVGVTLLIMFVQLVVGFIPILGALSGFFLNGVFYGGLYYYYLGKLRGEPRELGDAFAGFSKAFVPLMLTTLLTSTLILAIMLPFLAPWFVIIFKAAFHSGGPPPVPSLAMIVGFLVAFIPLIYLSVSWGFAFLLVIDRGLGPWTAMEVSRRVVTRQWFRVFFVMFLGGFLAMLGLIGLLIGVFFTLPLAFGALVCAYEDLCNPPPKPD